MDDDLFAPRQPILLDWPPRPATPPRRRRLDWRSVVGGLGRLLIALGVLLLGFVAYQLWGTSIQQARSQDRLQDRFAALVGGATAAATAPATTTAVPVATSGGPSLTAITAGPTTVAPTTTLAPATTAPPVTAPPRPGDPIARLVIPKIGVDQVVVSGVGLAELEKAPGHYPDTPMPGEIGNAAIAGHRSTFGAPFARVDELERGDQIDVTTPAGTFVYRVVDSVVVEPTEISVIANTPDAQLTLTSCWPKWSADKRIVVRAALEAPAAVVPSTPSPATEAATPPSTVAAATTVAPATTVAAPSAPTTAAPAAPASTSTDAFRQGWWADDAAWGDVIAWGSALSGVALAAWLLSRRTRRNWLGGLIGIAPFIVFLYFFYENVARLLPPSI